MVYTCAYFPTPDATLEEAQIAKMDLVCRKLRLKPGDRVIEAGCGWGSLALFMARHYGVTVRAFNISRRADCLRAEARDGARASPIASSSSRTTTATCGGTCDVFVSVGMLEHVGLPDYPTLGRVIDRSLTGSTGAGCCTSSAATSRRRSTRGFESASFPARYPPTLREVFEHVLEPHALSVLDVENLRLHYAKTLEHWRRRFDDAADQVATMFDEHVCARLAALSGGLAGGVHDRLHAAVPGPVRARRQQRAALDAGRRLTAGCTPWTRATC